MALVRETSMANVQTSKIVEENKGPRIGTKYPNQMQKQQKILQK